MIRGCLALIGFLTLLSCFAGVGLVLGVCLGVDGTLQVAQDYPEDFQKILEQFKERTDLQLRHGAKIEILRDRIEKELGKRPNVQVQQESDASFLVHYAPASGVPQQFRVELENDHVVARQVK
jgi:hypothetical protein